MNRHLHGGEVYSIARSMRLKPEDFIDFSSNANCFARNLTDKLVKETAYPYLHYPDSSSLDLAEAVGEHEGADPARVLPGNGAAELIWLTLQGLNPARILFIGPIFSEYVRAATSLGIAYEILTPSPEHDFTCLSEDMNRLWETSADLVVLCNPNNPAAVTYDNILSVLPMLRAPRVLIDNSYREFLYGQPGYMENHWGAYTAALRQGVSLFTLHSFTKFFCCPGIRLGYLMGERTAVARIRSRQPSWSVSPYAQVMGRVFLEHIEKYRQTLNQLNAAVTALGQELRRLPFMIPEQVFDGPGFVAARLRRPATPARVRDLLQKQKILIRDCDNIPGMPEGFIRIQARPDKDREALLQALAICG